jgi:hypothetical protein
MLVEAGMGLRVAQEASRPAHFAAGAINRFSGASGEHLIDRAAPAVEMAVFQHSRGFRRGPSRPERGVCSANG